MPRFYDSIRRLLEDFKDENNVIDNFFKIAKGAISDGADVIILGCVNCSTMLTYQGISHVDGVPIVDGAIASLKRVEVMAQFKRAELWQSKKTISNEIIEGLRKGYYHGSGSA